MNVGQTSRPRRSFPAQASAPRAARAFVAERLSAEGATPTVVDDFTLAVSEVVTNAVTHGDDFEVIVVVDTSDAQWWHIEVVNGSPLPAHLQDAANWKVAPAPAPSGRGLGIVRTLMDEVAVLDAGRGLALRRRRQSA